ncbi:MAG: hypothetical protein KDA86_04725 [Planctomycetaceae bacterium]|nr:hypothetical protein [Planctomycetaceae bacterium]
MSDLYLGIAILVALMVASFLLAAWLTRRSSTVTCDVWAAITVIGIAVYARWIWEDTLMARLFPYSNLIILSNWFPIAAGFLAGLVWQRIRDTPERIPGLGTFRGLPRRIFATVILAAAGCSTLVAPLLGEPPECGNEWDGDLCYQTSGATCSAAAASTLLQFYGVYASEGEMAERCLTRRGTNWKGLYRGLTLTLRSQQRRPEVVDLAIDELKKQFADPCILQCELKIDEDGPTLPYELNGWVPGQAHSVVLMDIRGDRFQVFDPSVGMEVWPRDAMQTLWHGQVFRVIADKKP